MIQGQLNCPLGLGLVGVSCPYLFLLGLDLVSMCSPVLDGHPLLLHKSLVAQIPVPVLQDLGFAAQDSKARVRAGPYPTTTSIQEADGWRHPVTQGGTEAESQNHYLRSLSTATVRSTSSSKAAAGTSTSPLPVYSRDTTPRGNQSWPIPYRSSWMSCLGEDLPGPWPETYLCH